MLCSVHGITDTSCPQSFLLFLGVICLAAGYGGLYGNQSFLRFILLHLYVLVEKHVSWFFYDYIFLWPCSGRTILHSNSSVVFMIDGEIERFPLFCCLIVLFCWIPSGASFGLFRFQMSGLGNGFS
jgi:hypothetical protein